MSTTQVDATFGRRPLRLWPGVAAVALQWVIWMGFPRLVPNGDILGVLGGALLGLVVLVWWLFLSRLPWIERLGGLLVMVAALAATPTILHESVATGGQGVLFFIHALPVLSLGLVGWAVATRRLPPLPRRAILVVVILVCCGVFALLRTSGVSASKLEFAWRWSPTSEERLLARGEEPAAPAAVLPERSVEWPGFRGPGRDGVAPGVRIATDWSAAPPVELWRRPVGPGWSSFAVRGDLVYTQEQRGDHEIVACYRASTGKPVWRHRDRTRFWEANGGPGPRATPTLGDGRVYTFGATGIVNALDAADGSVLWSRDVVAETGKEIPYWGFAGSPLVMGDLVVVAAGGRLVAFDTVTGERRWIGPDGGWGYSSPHRMRIDGDEQIVLLNGAGVIAVAPADGRPLWEHSWRGAEMVQPSRTVEGDLLVGAARAGICRLAVTRDAGGWRVEERWASSGLKPYFNDFVVHEGHAYGFDGAILACVDLEDGRRRWKGGRYGNGQLVLLPDQDLLLVVSERGELALVPATPDRFTELARLPALEGKTWNHPVVVGSTLLVRNGQEMAAFRLAPPG